MKTVLAFAIIISAHFSLAAYESIAKERYTGISSYTILRNASKSSLVRPQRVFFQDQNRIYHLLFMALGFREGSLIVEGRIKGPRGTSPFDGYDEFSALCTLGAKDERPMQVLWADGHEKTEINPNRIPDANERFPYNLWWAACRREYNKFK